MTCSTRGITSKSPYHQLPTHSPHHIRLLSLYIAFIYTNTHAPNATQLNHPHSDSSPGGGGSPSSASFFAWPFLGPLLFENQTSDARDHCANERTFLSYLRLSVYMAVVAVAIVLSFHLKSRPSPAELRMAKPLGLVFWCLSVACLLVGLGNYIREFSCLSLLCPSRPFISSAFESRGDQRVKMNGTDMLGCLVETVNKYSRKAAIVQSGIKTQLVSLARSSLLPHPKNEIIKSAYGGPDTTDYCQTMGIVSLSIIATCVTLLVVNKMSQGVHSS